MHQVGQIFSFLAYLNSLRQVFLFRNYNCSKERLPLGNQRPLVASQSADSFELVLPELVISYRIIQAATFRFQVI
jgi:hypothetical protein